MAHLGLGEYGSDDEDEETKDSQTEDIGRAPVALLGTYQSGEGAGLFGITGIDAAPDVQEGPAEGDLGEDKSSSPLQTPGGEDGAAAPGQTLGPALGPAIAQLDASPGNPLDLLPAELRHPPPGECSIAAVKALQRIVTTSQQQRRSFIESLRSNRQYSNPDLLQQLVDTYGFPEHGSAFAPEVFDPGALPKEDYLAELVAALEREQERRKAARASAPPGSTQIAFERGTGPLGVLPATASNPNLQAVAQAAAQAVAAAGMAGAARPPGLAALAAQAQAQAAAHLQQQQQQPRKRSKWDSAK